MRTAIWLSVRSKHRDWRADGGIVGAITGALAGRQLCRALAAGAAPAGTGSLGSSGYWKLLGEEEQGVGSDAVNK